MNLHYDVIIIGGGLSGFSSCITLLEHNKKVLLLEARGVLGGRTSSWNERGMEIESGLHRYLGFFEAFPELFEKTGVKLDDIIFWEDEIEIRLPDGKPSVVFGVSPLKKPLETFGALLINNDFISPDDKLKISKFFSQGFMDFKTNPEKLDSKTVYAYAKEHGLSNDAITRELIPLTEGLFFLPIKKYSALNFFALFFPYLPKLHKSRAGAFNGGMTKVLMEPLKKYAEKKGATIQKNMAVSDFIYEDGRVSGVVCGKKKIFAKNVILATSLKNAQDLLRKKFKKNPGFQGIFHLKTMPSVTFQIELSEPSMEIDRTTFSPETIFSAYAEQSRSTFKKSKGRISIILAEPEKYVSMAKEKILKKVLYDAKRLNLNLPEKSVLDFRKVVWEHDFYSYEKGMYDNRPSQKTPISGLYVAGDYTMQEYLQTMEGAVVSGRIAAEEALKVIN